MKIGDYVRFSAANGDHVGVVRALESHRGFTRADVHHCNYDNDRWAARWIDVDQLHKMTDDELMLWKLESELRKTPDVEPIWRIPGFQY
jgi:hypothetical protein